MRKRPTIQMVADIAGVSRGTVDRVLNNRSHVKPEVYARVIDALKETGYLQPRTFHQNVLQKSPYPSIKLGVLLPNWIGHFKYEIMKGIETARKDFEDLNIDIFIEECQTDIPQEVIERIDNLLKKEINGLSICAPNLPTINNKVKELLDNNIPVITFNSDLPDSGRIAFVGQDYHQSGRIAGEIISKCISKNTSIISAVGNLEYDGHKKRISGFQERLKELGFQDSQIHIIETFNDYQITYKKVLECLEKYSDIGAVYMANRSVAGCTEAIKTANKKGELKVVCHDVAESTRLLLKDGSIDFTISQDIARQGYLPIVLLREYLQKGKSPESKGINTEIHIICSQNL